MSVTTQLGENAQLEHQVWKPSMDISQTIAVLVIARLRRFAS